MQFYLIIFFIFHFSGGVNFEKPDFDAALNKAKQHDSPLLIEFYSATCCPLNDLHELIFNDKEVSTFINENFICIRVDVGTELGETLIKKYGRSSLPAVFIVDQNGNEIDRIIGIYLKENYLNKLKDYAQNKNSFGELVMKVQSNPDDRELILKLANEYSWRGQRSKAIQYFEEIVKHNPYSENDQLWMRLSWEYFYSENYKKANDAISMAIKLKPDNHGYQGFQKTFRSAKGSKVR